MVSGDVLTLNAVDVRLLLDGCEQEILMATAEAYRAHGRGESSCCTLADILEGRAAARNDKQALTVFSPFGLGVLDLAVAHLVVERASEQRRGTLLKNFLPATN